MSELVGLQHRLVEHPWGCEDILESNPYYKFSLIQMPKGFVREDTYDNQFGAFYVIDGKVSVFQSDTLPTDPRDYNPNQAWIARERRIGPTKQIITAETDFTGLEVLIPDVALAREMTGHIETDEIGDLTPADKYIDKRPWGHEWWIVKNGLFVLKNIRMEKAGQRSSLQLHRRKFESNYLLEGSAKIVYGRAEDNLKEMEVKPGQGWTALPMVIHRVISLEPYSAIEVSTPEIWDIVRLRDDHGRGIRDQNK